MKSWKCLGLLPLLLCFSCATKKVTYQPQDSYNHYINLYKNTAKLQQQKYGIPASITLAQGLLESGAGASRLAVQANNHFGIKCHDWTGKSIRHDDDERDECFRRYSSPSQSYEDHSLFLTQRSRYATLFDLHVTDYKGWARGLKRCGYATDPQYAEKLIRIIETYELHHYDVKQTSKSPSNRPNTAANATQVLEHNGLRCVIVRDGDRLADIAQMYKKSIHQLYSYNDINNGYILMTGDIIYLERKHKRAVKPLRTHCMASGESMHYISQLYGIRLNYLYRLNDMWSGSRPTVGDTIKLR